LGVSLGLFDGALLWLGNALGAGLLLGTVLGISVGHDGDLPSGDGTDKYLVHKETWVMAVGPNK
jgi:hypothetical protein